MREAGLVFFYNLASVKGELFKPYMDKIVNFLILGSLYSKISKF